MLRLLRSQKYHGQWQSTLLVVALPFFFLCALSYAATEGPQSSQAETTQAEADKQLVAQSGTVPAGLVQLPAHSRYYAPYAFIVDKQTRTLTVWNQTGSGLKAVASFPADLGKNAGAKRSRNDHKTPEGIYFLLTKLEGAEIDFHLYGQRAFTSDYPNFFDRAEGKTGSGIWLHAVPDEVPLTRGSRGCVVVRNNVIADLTKYITLGRTPMLIQNKTAQISPKKMAVINAELQQWLESWRANWESKNLEAYIENYDQEFRDRKMDRAKWKEFKQGLNEKYAKITVRLSKPAIFADRDRVIIRFLQEYTSDQHADFGEKVLYLKKRGSAYRIVGESWSQESSQTAHDEIEATTSATAGEGANSTNTHASAD